jgi:hypothetical protein
MAGVNEECVLMLSGDSDLMLYDVALHESVCA